LDDADKQRREDFKRYEMEKEFDHKRKLEQVDGEAKKKEEQEWEEKQKKHKDHPKVKIDCINASVLFLTRCAIYSDSHVVFSEALLNVYKSKKVLYMIKNCL